MMSIEETIATILSPPRGMLVADEYAESLVSSTGDRAKVNQFAAILTSTPELSSHVSSVLLTRETFDAVAPRISAGPLVGVRLTTRSETATVFTDLVRASASFVEWRAHLSPQDVPRGGVHIEAASLANGAAAAQQEGLLPVLTVAMPDLGSSSIGLAQAVTSNALAALRKELATARVDARRLLLRVNMVVAGEAHPSPWDPEQVADLTLTVLERHIPSETAGVLLLSGGQPLNQACGSLRAISTLASQRSVPWPVTFGFSRPLVSAAAAHLSGPEGTEAEAGLLLVQSARMASESLAPVLVSDGKLG